MPSSLQGPMPTCSSHSKNPSASLSSSAGRFAATSAAGAERASAREIASGGKGGGTTAQRAAVSNEPQRSDACQRQTLPERSNHSSASRGAHHRGRTSTATRGRPVPHKDFSDVYEKMSGKGASAGEAHRVVVGVVREGDWPPNNELVDVPREVPAPSNIYVKFT